VITTPCSFDHDRRRLQNVFNKLAVPNHPLRAAAFQLRDEISTTWCRQAEATDGSPGQAPWLPMEFTNCERSSGGRKGC
jgi:hypothetical protein